MMKYAHQVARAGGRGGGGNSHIKGTRMLCVLLGGKIDRFWSPFRLLKTESHYF